MPPWRRDSLYRQEGLAYPDARRRDVLRASREPLIGQQQAGAAAPGSASVVVVSDRPPWNPRTGAVAPGAGLPDDPAVEALNGVAAHGRGVWVCRSGEVEPTVPVRRRLVDPPAVAIHDAGHEATTWPLYHDLGPGRYDPAWRLAFRATNAAYAEAAALEAAPGATVWVHGHTLQLVPRILRRSRPDLRIGMYLPTHFPDDTLRGLPMYREVLQGLLAADLVGFQTASAAENFLRRTHELTDTPPSVGVFPTAAQTPAIAALVATPAVTTAAAELRVRLGDPRTVLLCVNPPEQSQGVPQRLLALGSAMRDGRLDASNTVVVQILLGRPTDASLFDAIGRAASRVNGEHSRVGRPAVHYIVDTPSLAERVAYYRSADVLLATPSREGSTTAALEFVAAARDEAALVLSELSGTASVLPDAFLANPHDADGVQAGLTAALASPTVRRERMDRMRSYVTGYHISTWTESFLRTLRAMPVRPAPAVHAVAAPHVVRQTHPVQTAH
jgi:trehalose 6-phosphate synthase